MQYSGSSSTSRSKPLNPAGVAAAEKFLQDRIKAVGYYKAVQDLTKGLIRAYLAEATKPENLRKGRWSTTTLRLAQMEVGSVIHVPAMAPQSLYGRIKSARKLTGNPGLRFHINLLTTNEFRVTRREDFSPDFREVPSPVVTELVMLQPGQSTIIPQTANGKTTPSRSYLIRARKLLDDPDARWIFRSTTKGIRATRIR